jgi:hypothetical protein
MRRSVFAGANEPGGPALQAPWEMPQLATGAVMLRRGLHQAMRAALLGWIRRAG